MRTVSLLPSRVLAILVLATGALVASARPAAAVETEVGILGGVFAGKHIGSDNPDPQYGVVPAGLLEVSVRSGRAGLRLEGIPEVTAYGSGSGPFGRSKASLAVLNSYLTAAVDPAQLIRVGIGTQLIDLANTNGRNGDINQARVFSLLLHADGTLPLPDDHAVEIDLNVVPNVRTDLRVFNYLGQIAPDKPEAGAEEDLSLKYRWRSGPFVLRAGVRGIDYSTRNTSTGEEVDRNIGAGVTFDARFAVGKP